MKYQIKVIFMYNMRQFLLYLFKILNYSACSIIRTHWARFFCKHIRITKNPDDYKKPIFHKVL